VLFFFFFFLLLFFFLFFIGLLSYHLISSHLISFVLVFLFLLLYIHARFRMLIQGFPSVVATAKLMVAASEPLKVPVIVTEQNPKALGQTGQKSSSSAPSPSSFSAPAIFFFCFFFYSILISCLLPLLHSLLLIFFSPLPLSSCLRLLPPSSSFSTEDGIRSPNLIFFFLVVPLLVSDINVFTSKLFTKMKFSMLEPQVEEYLNSLKGPQGEKVSNVVLFGIEVSPLTLPLVFL
jgi:hypothetical protein